MKVRVDIVTLWQRVARQAHAVEIRRFSATTMIGDVHYLPADIRDLLNEGLRIEKVWRARIGRARRWHYGLSPEEALGKALDFVEQLAEPVAP